MRKHLAAVAVLAAAASCGNQPATTVLTVGPGGHENPHTDHRRPHPADPTEGLAAALQMQRPVKARAARSRPRPAPRGAAGGGCTLEVIRQRESGGDYQAVSRSGKYRGAYQFDARTWASVGGSGDPAAASPEEQDARAAELMRRRGTQPWSVC